MTAIKKSAKTAKTPTPASKTASTAKVASTATVPAATLAAKRSPTVSAVKPKPDVTTITARINTGFGNALYVRGDGPGLSWDNGVPMTCISSDEWQLTLPESSRAINFKVLINDTTWSNGTDFTVAAGDRVTITPAF
jgi:hypothetical protein